MKPASPRVVLITGASSGIGKACAEYLQGLGYRVYGTSRRAAALPPEPGPGLRLIAMDVTSEESVRRAVELVLAREGRIDVVVNNAGWGIAGSVEDTSIAEAQEQLDANFFGVLRVCQAVLPTLRRQGSGCIVNISSMGGLVSIPFQGLYSASKFAVEGMTESLRMELRPLGIRVAMIEPGDFRTGFTAERRMAAAAAQGPYHKALCTAVEVMEKDEQGGATPEAIAWRLEKIIEARDPKLRHLVGPLAQRFAVGVLRKLLPQRWFERMIAGYYGIA
ncbi:short-chain dehydrogenase/reductase [Solimonas fluminis]|uniref:Short-chain dehydrogenase/reductase n=1 Tax=Solimonas fluminis TaxID=2086571 RepID=A0A2S5TBW0_9GAMM|nr:SDR family oxidoreductase [Solimonas fluminis]PPE72318.1 short-chain dehydrogenase/reductase [Solimonas fluminis]